MSCKARMERRVSFGKRELETERRYVVYSRVSKWFRMKMSIPTTSPHRWAGFLLTYDVFRVRDHECRAAVEKSESPCIILRLINLKVKRRVASGFLCIRNASPKIVKSASALGKFYRPPSVVMSTGLALTMSRHGRDQDVQGSRGGRQRKREEKSKADAKRLEEKGTRHFELRIAHCRLTP